MEKVAVSIAIAAGGGRVGSCLLGANAVSAVAVW